MSNAMVAEKLQYMYVLQAVDPLKAASRENWTAHDQETFDLHWDRLVRLREAGTVLLAGRAQDADGGGPAIVIFEADSEEDARRLVDEEPFVTRGFATATLHPFRIALAAGREVEP
jgi:uncharacterized protein YciI